MDQTGAGIVRRLHHAFNERDREGFLASLDAEVRWHVPGDSPMAGSYEGRDRVWADLMEPLWPAPARVQDDAIIEHDDYVVAVGQQLHDFGQGELRFATIEVCRHRDGVVLERWEFTSGQAELDRLLALGCPAPAELTSD
jgi:ketosteroid isomerase-like protein